MVPHWTTGSYQQHDGASLNHWVVPAAWWCLTEPLGRTSSMMVPQWTAGSYQQHDDASLNQWVLQQHDDASLNHWVLQQHDGASLNHWVLQASWRLTVPLGVTNLTQPDDCCNKVNICSIIATIGQGTPMWKPENEDDRERERQTERERDREKHLYGPIFLMFFFNVLLTYIVIYPYNKNQQDALFTFNLFQ